MATPTIPQKRLLAAGAVRSEQVWGTAEAMGAGYGILIETDGGVLRNQPYLPAREADTPFVLEGDLGNIEPVDFAPEFTMRYDPGALGTLIAQLFGTAGAPTDLTGAYKHTFQWADENYGEFATFAIERAAKIFEVASAKPYVLDLSIADALLKGKIGLRGNTLINTSTVNTLTQMDALTYKDRGKRIKFSQVTVKMNNQSAGDLWASTALEIADLTVHYERPHDGIHKAGSASIIEPSENGQPIITVTLNFPRMNAINKEYFEYDFVPEVEKKLLIMADGAVITGSNDSYYLQLWFPRMRIINIDYPLDDVIPATITLQSEEAAAAPSGMSYARPYALLVNTRSTDYLATK